MAMRWFGGKRETTDPHGIEAARAHFGGGFRMVYERKELPGYGSAQQYALESYALPPFPPSGPSITVRDPFRPTSAPLYQLHSVPLAGIPLQAGMLYGAPLFDPNNPGGFVGTGPINRVFVPNVVDPTTRRDNRLG